jgi:hypothetical protein
MRWHIVGKTVSRKYFSRLELHALRDFEKKNLAQIFTIMRQLFWLDICPLDIYFIVLLSILIENIC